MNTQNTPVHVNLWHKDFWLVVVADLLLSMSVTMLIPTLPRWMMFVDGLTEVETGISMGAFAVGLFLLGGFSSYLVQRYRRNMVCVWATLALALSLVLPIYFGPMSLEWAVAMRLAQGATYGLALMVLTSTLVIDTCESNHRTEANFSATWFGRFALSLGPTAGLLLLDHLGMDMLLYVAAGCCVLAVVLVLMVHIPFRVPKDHFPVFCLDRFFLTRGWVLFIELLLIMASVGMMLALSRNVTFYALMMVGFMLALLAQRFVFPDAELKSEVVTGLIVMLAVLLIMLYAPTSVLQAPLLGFSLGIVGSRFLLFFIKLSDHCQRGTAQSTYLLGWETGLAIGVGMGYACFDDNRNALLQVAIVLVLVALAMYSLLLHQWFVDHKKR
ncbi:MAG: MFS transporter [Prevotella sp.]|nr:MFS transporter [Prevotella sp.]